MQKRGEIGALQGLLRVSYLLTGCRNSESAE